MLDDDLKNIFKLTIAFRFGRDVPDDWDDRDEIGGEESVVMYHNVLEKLVYYEKLQQNNLMDYIDCSMDTSVTPIKVNRGQAIGAIE